MEVCGCSPRRRAPLAGTPHSQSRSPQSRHSSSRFRNRSTVFRRSAAGSHKIHGPSRRHTLVHRANSIASRLFLVLHRSRKSRSSQCQPHSRRPGTSPPLLVFALRLLFLASVRPLKRTIKASRLSSRVKLRARVFTLKPLPRGQFSCLQFLGGAFRFLEPLESLNSLPSTKFSQVTR